MKNLQNLILIGFLSLLFSCNSTSDKPGYFNLLPQPQQFEIKGVSSLKYNDIQNYYSIKEIALPVRGELLTGIVSIEKQSKAQIVFKIDGSIDLPNEGYLLEISSKQITIVGKDEAGLFYAFMTLEQLMVDAKEQNVNLPLCNIRDYPALSYRAIHLDVKHHLEKTDYYYKLIDRLASYKVNGIIAEMEDKIKYKRQPGVGSADALSIDEWKKLSSYAKERNIEVSPLIQGLGHASFVLKHNVCDVICVKLAY